jgi:hypothetical protein
MRRGGEVLERGEAPPLCAPRVKSLSISLYERERFFTATLFFYSPSFVKGRG